VGGTKPVDQTGIKKVFNFEIGREIELEFGVGNDMGKFTRMGQREVPEQT
jgi:hypothetical protein